MAARYVISARTALKGTELVPGRWLLRDGVASCHCSRLLHVSPAVSMCSSRTEQQSRRAGQEDDEGPEYIPRRHAKNPMMKVGFAWIIGLPTAIIGFILTKRQVDKNRLKQLKIRQRMRLSNEGEYEGNRYRCHKENIGLDR